MGLPPRRQTPLYLSGWGKGAKDEGVWVKETQKDKDEEPGNRHTKEYAGDPILQPLDLPSFGTGPPVMEGSTLESVDASLTTSYFSFVYMRRCLKHFQ